MNVPEQETVTLVIDDGPSDVTGKMLDAIEAAGHRAVLFLLGCNIKGREGVLVDAIHRGFALGNHSFSHPTFSKIDVAAARRELLATESLLDDLYRRAGVPRPGNWFRFPYLDTGGAREDAFQRLLAELGFTIPGPLRDRLPAELRGRRDWPSTLVTRDWALPADAEFQATLNQARPGDVIEYHDKIETVNQLCAPLIRGLDNSALKAVVPARGVDRVFLVSWWMDRIGGMERHITELALALARSGIHVEYFSEMPLPAGNAYRRQLESGGIRVHSPTWLLERVNAVRRRLWRVPALRPLTARNYAGIDRHIEGDLLGHWLIEALTKATDRGRPDALHIHGTRLGQVWLVEWARAREIPSLYTEHVAIADMGGPWDPAAPAIARRAGVLASVSAHSRDSLISVLPSPREVAVTPHIVPEPTPGHAAKASAFHWACVARLAGHKGIDVLLHGFARCAARDPRYRLTLAGDGPDRPALIALVGQLGLTGRVTFAGVVPPDELSGLLRSVGGVVLASRTEGLPVSLVEAMAHGRAIVATRVGGIPELLTDGETALLVDPEDHTGLGLAIERISTDNELRARLETAAYQRFLASEYQETSAVSNMLGLYRQAAGRRR